MYRTDDRMSPLAMFGITMGILLAIAFVSTIGICFYNGGVPYSEGYREGHIQKFSNKGYIWKTFEGEMATLGFKTRGNAENPSVSNVFEFTVIDPEICKQIETIHTTEPVRMYYKQYWLSPPWMGSTGYRIVRIEKIQGDSP